MSTPPGGSGQQWDAYGAVFLAMLVAAAAPVALHFIGRALSLWSAKTIAPTDTQPGVAPLSPEAPLNTRYFSALQMGGLLALPAFSLLLIFRESGARATFAVLSLCSMVGAALVYANRKGDLRWDDHVESNADEPDLAEEERES